MLVQLPILFSLYQVIWNVPAYVSSVKDAMMGLVNQLLSLKRRSGDPDGVCHQREC